MIMKKFFMTMAIVASLTLSGQAEMIHVVGTEYPPFTHTSPEDGKPTGFAIELLQTMFEDLSIDSRIELFTWKRAEVLLTDNPNTLALMARTEQRETLYKWVGPVYPRTLYLYRLKTRPDLQLNTIDDVKSYKVGVVRGYASVTEVLNAGVPQNNLDEVSADSLNIKKLFSHRIDFLPNNDMVLAHLLRQEGYSFDQVEHAFVITPEGQSYFYYGLNRSTDDALVQKLQNALETLKSDGRYDAILQRYLQ